jgi:membrane-associated HD superfamily phosphohydrolase
MLADAAEAASRSFRNSSPEEIEENVTRIVNRAYLDGQLNECDMTLRDLHAVGKAFSKGLSAISHTRVEYPNTPASGVR